MNLADMKAAAEEATPGERSVDGDDRDGMEWNNNVIFVGTSNTLCFMAHGDPCDQDEWDANAELIASCSRERILAMIAVIEAVDTYTATPTAANFQAMRTARAALEATP